MTRAELEAIVKSSTSKTNVFYTHGGSQITLKEFKFINEFIKSGDLVASVQAAGYTTQKNDAQSYQTVGRRLLAKPYIYEEMMYRIEEINKAAVADAGEVMEYFTKVMRGEEKDQFGLDAPLSERTSAAKELAKRLIDIPQKATEEDRAIQIVLDWKRPSDDTTTD